MFTDEFVEVCFICLRSVEWGSGKYVNRIPAVRAPDEPNAYICSDCDPLGSCDECGASYDVSDRDGRCGNCGGCARCCLNDIEVEV